MELPSGISQALKEYSEQLERTAARRDDWVQICPEVVKNAIALAAAVRAETSVELTVETRGRRHEQAIFIAWPDQPVGFHVDPDGAAVLFQRGAYLALAPQFGGKVLAVHVRGTFDSSSQRRSEDLDLLEPKELRDAARLAAVVEKFVRESTADHWSADGRRSVPGFRLELPQD